MFRVRPLLTASLLLFSLALLYIRFEPSLTLRLGLVSEPTPFQLFFSRDGSFSEEQSVTILVPASVVQIEGSTVGLSFPLPRTTKVRLDPGEGGEPIRVVSTTLSGFLSFYSISAAEFASYLLPAHDVELALNGSVVTILPTGRDPILVPTERFYHAVEKLERCRALGIALVLLVFTLVTALSRRMRISLPFHRALGPMVVVLLSAFAFRDFLVGGSLPLYVDVGFDTFALYWPMLTYWANEFRSTGTPFWPFWSFHVGPGMSIGPYLLDPFHLLLVLAGEAFIPPLLGWMAATKVMLVGLAFYLLLGFYPFQPFVRLLGTLLFTFNGFLIVWGQHFQYATFTLNAVLICLAVEYLIHRGRSLPLAGSSAIACLQNVYLFSLLIPFTFLYLNVRLLMLNRRRMRSNAIVIAAISLGFAAMGFLAIPELVRLLSAGHGSWPSPESIRLGSLLEQFTTISRSLSNDLYGVGSSFTGRVHALEPVEQNYYTAPNLYAGVLAVLLIPQVFALETRRNRLLFAGLIALALLLLLSPFLRFVLLFGANVYLRELSLFIVIFTVLIAAHGLDRGLAIGFSLRTVAFTVAAISLFLVLATYLTPTVQKRVAIEILIFATLYGAMLASYRPDGPHPLLLLTLCMAVSVEALTSAGRALTERMTVPAAALHVPAHYRDSASQAIQFLRATDSEIYRVHKLESSVAVTDSLMQGYMGLAGYFSPLNPSYLDFLRGFEIPTVLGNRMVTGLGDQWTLYGLLGTKYFLTRTPQAAVPDTAEVVKVGEWRILRNLNFHGFGRVVHSAVDAENFHSFPLDERVHVIQHSLILPRHHPFFHDLTGGEGEPENVVTIRTLSNSGIHVLTEARQAGVLFLPVPYDPGWRASVNGEPAAVERVNLGFLGVPVPSGPGEVVLRYRPAGFLAGCAVSAAGILTLLGGPLFLRRRLQ